MKNNWQIKKLEEGIAKIMYGKANPNHEGKVPVIGSSGVYAYTKSSLVTKPTIIVGRKGTAGAVYYSEVPCWPSDTAFYLDVNFDLFDPKFLYFFINHKKLDGLDSKTTLPSLKRQDLEELLVPLVDLQEQREIIYVLDTIQETINIQNEIVEKTKELKAALIQMLFTEGTKGEKLKDSEIGKIPESWEIRAIENSEIEIIDGDRGYNYPKNSEFLNAGYCLFLNTKNVSGDKFDFTECKFISKEKDSLLRKGKLQREDIVLTTRGTVGNVAYYNSTIGYDFIRINSGMVILRNKSKIIDTEFMFNCLKSSLFRVQSENQCSGSAQQQLPIGTFKRFLIAIPSLEEQKVISGVIKILDKKSEFEQKKSDLYQELFDAMLDTLMSGEINVDAINFKNI